MEYVDSSSNAEQKTMVLCCICAIPIDPNAANMCMGCLRSRVDITEGIMKQGQVVFCKFCERYLSPPNTWLVARLESKELLQICLKRMKGLDKVRLVDSGFVWTEPHSKRIKVKLTVQQEVMSGLNIQQSFVVEYVVLSQICDDCRRVENKDYWRAAVQVRQKVPHKKTLFYLEQLILKHNAHANTTGITSMENGIDFFYPNKQEARKMVDFIQTVLPARYKTAEELVSHDTHNNTFDYKHTFSMAVAPICRDSLVCLPKKLAQSLGNFAQICLCRRISSLIHLIDPATTQIADVSATVYFRYGFEAVLHSDKLTEFTVIDIDSVMSESRVGAGHGQMSNRHSLAEAWVVKSSLLGTADGDEISVRTHLGHLLNPGDTVMGYDLKNANVNHEEFNQLGSDKIPDVVLVRKNFGNRQKRSKKRNWQLKHLTDEPVGAVGAADTLDYVEFLEDLEEDPQYREVVNIYRLPVGLKSGDVRTVSDSEPTDDDAELPLIDVQEMLEDLQIGKDEDM